MTPVKVADVQSQEFGDEVLVFDGDLLQRLVGTAAAIWRHVDGVRSADQVVTALEAAYGEQSAVYEDVTAFLAALAAAGLICWQETTPGRFVVPAWVAWEQDDQTVLLADLRTGARAALSQTAALIWQLAGEGRTAEEVVAEAAAAYPDAPASLEDDVKATLRKLLDHGWLEQP